MPPPQYSAELQACQLHFRIKPCRYPVADTWGLLPVAGPEERLDCTALDTVSIDNASTKDIDDALSFAFTGDGFELPCSLGIHVADVASRLPCASPLFLWARERGGSAYHSGVGGEEAQGGGSVPMLPPELAHGELSLNEGVPRNAVSLFLEVDEQGQVTRRWHARTRIVNDEATSYDAFDGDEENALFVAGRQLLRKLSGADEADEMVAWWRVAAASNPHPSLAL